MKTRNTFWLFISILIVLFGCSNNNNSIKQIAINKIEIMPNQPKPYKMTDYHEMAINFDKVVFNFDTIGKYHPFIWIDSIQRNIPQTTFGIYTAVGDIRQGPNKHNGEFHEALCSLGAVLSGGLTGIDKENQDGFNYVKMLQNYFNSSSGWDIIMNNTSPEVASFGGGYGHDWWYDVFPNVLYYAVSDLFPNVSGENKILKIVANKFYLADSVLNGNYNYSYFDYSTMKGMKNNIPFQQDAAAGHAYVLYGAYKKFGDPRYLKGAKSATKALLSQKESRFYEILMPFGAYVAARLNAEQGTQYNVTKILNWTFNGCTASDGRTGWGVIADRWGNYDVSGLQGSITDNGGYGFLMNTYSLAWPLVALVRYDPHYARAIGKWMLNAANAARFCYPYEIPDKNQWLPEKKTITRNVIAYEGIRKTDTYNKKSLKGISPVALGDGPQWAKNQPDVSMFSIYGSAYAGIYGSIIKKTNVEQILQLDCLATDFYRSKAYPTFLYYNPYEKEKIVEYFNEEAKVDLYDALTHTTVAKNVSSKGKFTIQGNKAMLIVAIPSGSKIKKNGNKYFANDIAITYQ